MANVKITELTALTDPASSDVLPIVDVGADTTKKVTIADLLENAGDGAAATPAFSFDNDKSVGMWRPGSEQLAFSTSGTTRLFINSSGNIGVNTSSPTQKLHVVGIAKANTGFLFGDTESYLYESANNAVTLRIGQDGPYAEFIDVGSSVIEFGNASGELALTSSGTEKVRIKSDGKVGVGTISPGAYVHAHGSAGDHFRASNGSNNFSILCDGTNSLLKSTGPVFYRAGSTTHIFQNADGTSEAMRINSAGQLLVGVTSATHGSQATAEFTGSNSAYIFSLTNDTASDSDGHRFSYLAFTGKQSGGEKSILASVNGAHDGTADDTKGKLVFRTNSGSEGGTIPTARMTIDSAGRVGIGTSNPGAKLELRETDGTTIRLRRNSSTAVANDLIGKIDFFNNDSSTPGARVTATVGAYAQSTAGGTYLGFSTAVNGGSNTERLRVNSSGNVGINNLSPTEKLSVSGALIVTSNANNFAAATGGLIDYYANNMRIVATATSGVSNGITFTIANSGALSEAATIDSSGRLLVGTSSARTNFFNTTTVTAGIQAEDTGEGSIISAIRNINDANSVPVFLLAKSRGTSVGSNTIVQANDHLGYLSFQGSDGGQFVEAAQIRGEVDGTPGANDMPGRLVFSTCADGASTPTERMRITNGGGIGFGGGITIGNTTPTSNTAIYIGASVISSGAGNSTLKYSTATGLVTYDTSSRLVKENITDCPYGIESVKQLQPRKYFRTDDQNEEIGFIADELVEVLPEFVPVGPKSLITKNEEDTEEIPLGVNYEKLTAVLTSALQEAIAKIETLEQRLSDAGL